MRLYHHTSEPALDAILARGFRNEEIRLREAEGVAYGVRLSAPASVGTSAVGAPASLLLDIPDRVVSDFGRAAGDGLREYVVPAEIVNRYPITAVRRTDSAGTRAPPPALPAPPPAGARRPIIPLAAALLAVGAALGAYAIYDVASDDDDGERSAASGERPSREPVRAPPRVGSVAVGAPENGHLVRGVPFPAAGPHHFTWDPILRRSPNRRGRRYGTDRTVASVIEIAERYRRRHPRAPRVGVADLSLPRGGRFGVEYGGRGHTTHQNGLDADILYPHRDGREREAGSRGEIDRALAQALLNEFIRADAVTAIVDGALGLRGPPEVVQAMPYHETHMHVQVRRR